MLLAYLRWILLVTLVAVASACALSWALHHPSFESEIRVLVEPAEPRVGAAVAPDMETERQVAISGVVTAAAAQQVGVSATYLQEHASVTVPAASTVLVIQFDDTSAASAQRYAQAIADAYVDYRKGQAATLSAASMPTAATTPNYPVNGAAGLALGLIVGVGSALLRDRSDDRLRGPRDFVERTELPILATVPVRRRRWRRASLLPVLRDPSSTAGEAYRQVSGKVERAARQRRKLTTVTLFTSPSASDGVAHVAANTAIALAQSGHRVVLVECDVRVPRLAGLFDIPSGPGVARALVGRVPLNQALQASEVENLSLLPAGSPGPLGPGELFTFGAVGRLLSAIPADIDHVVVLTPPVLDAAETAVVAEHAHLLVLVAVIGATTRRDLEGAAAELSGGPSSLFGGVLLKAGRGGRAARRSQPLPAEWDDDMGPTAPEDDGVAEETPGTTAIDRRGRA